MGTRTAAAVLSAFCLASAGADGEVALTRKPRGDGYLVSTNFNVANPANGYQYPCPRYQRAEGLLGELVRREGELTARDAASVLDAVHMGGPSSWTIVSLVAGISATRRARAAARLRARHGLGWSWAPW